MKVLMTTDAVGGVWTYALELGRVLGELDVEVVLAVMGPVPSQSQREMVAALTSTRLVHGDFRLEWMEQPWSDVERAGTWLLELAAREQIDLVHLNGYAHASLAWSQPVLVVAHSCVCSWWQAVHSERAPANWDRYRSTVAMGLAAADVVVAPTAAFMNTLERLYGALARTRVIRNALPAPPLQPSDVREPIVLACGRAWDEAKNLSALDAAMQEVDARGYVVGDCTSPHGRSREFASLTPLGVLASYDVHRWMQRAAVFAHPPLYEPFGLAVLEAAQRGCALVLSDVPTLRELWDGAALFADPRDSNAFAACIRALLSCPNERTALARAATQRAREFQIDEMSAAYRSLYAELLASEEKELAVA